MAFFNTLSVYSWEIYPIPDWASVALAEVGFEAVLCLLYIWLMVLACVAVHRWRKREETRPSVERVIQLVEGALIERQHGDRAVVDRQFIERQLSDRQFVERQLVGGQPVERREHGKTDG